MFYILVVLFLAIPSSVLAHGDAWWIEQGHIKSLAGQLCCGESDCGMLDEDAVHATDRGYEVHGEVRNLESGWHYRVDELVPYDEAQPSPDGRFWRCAWPTQDLRKCFFSPPMSM